MHTFQQPGNDFDVAQQMLAVETADGQTNNFVACRRHLLHLHTVFCTDKEDVGIRTAFLDAIGYRQRREDVSAGAATADKYIQLFFHILIKRLVVQ